MVTLFFTALLLGFVFNAAPGPVFAETVRHAVRGGYRPALAVQFGSLVGDASWAMLGLAGVGLLLQLEVLRLPVGLAGVAYLLWLARDAWRAAGREFCVAAGGPEAASEPGNERRALRAGVALSLTNPSNVAYWAAIGSAMGAVGIAQPQTADYAVFFAGFMASSLLWCFVCAGALALVFARTGARWAAFTYRLCAAAFLVLALASLRDLLQPATASMAPRPAATVPASR